MSDEPTTYTGQYLKGQWPKGVSGNPGGYSTEKRQAVARVAELAREHTPAAIQTLATIMMDEKASRLSRIAAANALLDRAYGKPPQSVGIAAFDPDGDVAAEMSIVEIGRRVAFTLQRATHVLEQEHAPAESTNDSD